MLTDKLNLAKTSVTHCVPCGVLTLNFRLRPQTLILWDVIYYVTDIHCLNTAPKIKGFYCTILIYLSSILSCLHFLHSFK